MFFLNLGLFEFLGLFAMGGAVVVAMYLLSRARRKFRVSTLRFWTQMETANRQARRRRIDQPWSLLLQLLALLFLLLAIAQPRLGSPQSPGRDHVLLLDTSAWMAARRGNTAMEETAKRHAIEWLRRLPSEDRVMVVKADALATPVTPFETNRAKLEQAVQQAQPSSGVLDLSESFALALQAQRLQAQRPGEIVYSGPARVQDRDTDGIQAPPNLRMLPAEEVPANLGLTRVWVRRAAADPKTWQAFVAARNYGTTPRDVPLTAALGGSMVTSQLISLPPGQETVTSFEFSTRAAGWFETRLDAHDALPQDDYAMLELPAQPLLRVTAYTNEPELLRPLLTSDARVEARFLPPSQYSDSGDADLVLIDRFAPPAPPKVASVWIQPPAGSSPIPGRTVDSEVQLARWNLSHPLGAGLRSRDLKLTSAFLLQPGKGISPIAETSRGALIAARDQNPKTVVFGFHPALSSLRYELATPLLMAHILEWVAPDVFVRREVTAEAPGAIKVGLDETRTADQVKVLDEGGRSLPFTLEGRALHFFTAEPGSVRVIAGQTERAYSLTLPALGTARWQAPASTRQGPGSYPSSSPAPKEIWRWCAMVGAALIVLEWFLFGRRKRMPGWRWMAATAAKAAAVVAALISVSEPAIPVHETKLAVTLLADTSESMSGSDLATESKLAREIDEERGRNRVRLVPFARSLRELAPAEEVSGWKLTRTAGEGGRATNLEMAIRQAVTLSPESHVPRLVLISDGRETAGSVIRAAYQARQLGIPIDTYALPGRPEPKLKLRALRFPTVAFTGERVPIEMVVDSPQDSTATLEVMAESRSLGTSTVQLQPGENSLRAAASVATAGAIEMNIHLRTPSLGELHFQQALSLRRPKLLYISGDALGMETHLLQTLNAAQFDVVTNADPLRAKLDDYQITILNNWDLDGIPEWRKKELEKYVQDGGGLLIIGGEKNVYVEHKDKPLDPLQRALPATIAPPRTPEGTAVVLIIDKSSSMEGRKMELARLAAIGVVENLRPQDFVGVLIFDNSHQWAVPLRKAEDKTLIKRLIAGITPDGGTQIAPALAESYKRMLNANGAFKHIVLLTDGISEEGDSVTLAKDAGDRRITISTVGLGQDVNRSYLEKVATLAGGKSYFLTDPAGLEQILIKDVQEHTGSTTVEKVIQPKILKRPELLEGLPLEQAPSLKGYVRFQAKPQADTILGIPSEEGPGKDDPLLTRWQYGLGRAAVFTSDAKARWAESWVSWPGFDRFWANVIRDLLPHTQNGESSLSYDATNGQLLAEYRLVSSVPEPDKLPTLYALGTGGFQKPVHLERTGDHLYRARISIGTRQGLFRVRPLEESRLFPEVGIYIPEPELSSYGNDAPLLRQVAAYTGGRFNPQPGDVFRSDGRSVPSALRLWPGMIALAILLNWAELAWRRLSQT